ncbi:probable glycerol-3-phosphate dehydrogenase [Hippoglossus hippoglossus]|uniref:probable glycerol-3-phosphate dehydrogenase n=1 Tax=Hippoglossus hippoglossus TaxID=8267 RepID=UPI00148B82CA|nr:probable glycerol-3-phosphate dehydrogenase [Hippoglossus hippoglossus]
MDVLSFGNLQPFGKKIEVKNLLNELAATWILHMQISKLPLCRGDNFSSGTSSRSTELIHGGVRYLQKAITKLDYKQDNTTMLE